MQSRNRVAITQSQSNRGTTACRLPAYVNVAAFIAAVGLMSVLASTLPADCAYASLWLMPNLAGLAALFTCFVLEYRRMWGNKEPTWHRVVPVSLGSKALIERVWCRRISQVLMASGLICAMADWIVWPTQCSWEYPLALGAGMWIGNALWQRFSKA